MSSGLYVWSQTAASNATADSTINWAEGQAPSTINDSARAVMAGIAKYRDDIAGGIVTGGTSTAYTVTSNQVFDTLAHMHNQLVGFVPNATSTNAVALDVTLNVDGLGAKPIRAQPSVALPTGTLVLGTPYIATYNNTDGVFYLHAMTNQYIVPLGAGFDYWGSSAPNSCFAFPAGQQISQTTYASLYTLFGPNKYGADGGGLFFLPDKRGRVTAAADNMGGSAASRLTTAGGGVDGTTLGASGGNQNVTLAANQIPTITATNASQAISVTGSINGFQGSAFGGASQSLTNSNGVSLGPLTVTSSANNSISATYTNSSQVVTKTVAPTIVCNYIIRII